MPRTPVDLMAIFKAVAAHPQSEKSRDVDVEDLEVSGDELLCVFYALKSARLGKGLDLAWCSPNDGNNYYNGLGAISQDGTLWRGTGPTTAQQMSQDGMSSVYAMAGVTEAPVAYGREAIDAAGAPDSDTLSWVSECLAATLSQKNANEIDRGTPKVAKRAKRPGL